MGVGRLEVFCMRKLGFSLLVWALLSTVSALANDATTEPPVRGAVLHRVAEGETLEELSRLYGVDREALEEVNGTTSVSRDQTLWIPPSSKGWPVHQVERGQTLWRIGTAFGIPLEQLRQANGFTDDDNRLLPGNILVLPRAEKPQWTLTEKVAAPSASAPAESPAPSGGSLLGSQMTDRSQRKELSSRSASPTPLKPTLVESPRLGTWVEVRLPDNRRACVRSEALVLGSWQPQGAEELIQTARQFVGVPYRWGGTDPNGYDCSGFVQEVFRLSGHQVPRMADVQYQELNKVETDDLQVGDLVFFNTDGSGVSHVGIYTGDKRFLHASSSRGVIESSLEESYYSSRYVGGARLEAWDTEGSAVLTGSQDDQ